MVGLAAVALAGCDKGCDTSKVEIGWTPAQVTSFCGPPNRINVTDVGSGPDEQWVYGLREYVYVKDGHVTSRQWTVSP